nr:MAG TPA: hypothetical protein [Caudoviricetes sp.]
MLKRESQNWRCADCITGRPQICAFYHVDISHPMGYNKDRN